MGLTAVAPARTAARAARVARLTKPSELMANQEGRGRTLSAPAPRSTHTINPRRIRDETTRHRGAWRRPLIPRNRGHRPCSSKTCGDEDRRLPLRQLSVQHSEGREPSKLCAETERDRNHRHQKRHRRVHAEGREARLLCRAQGDAEKGWLHACVRENNGQRKTRA